MLPPNAFFQGGIWMVWLGNIILSKVKNSFVNQKNIVDISSQLKLYWRNCLTFRIDGRHSKPGVLQGIIYPQSNKMICANNCWPSVPCESSTGHPSNPTYLPKANRKEEIRGEKGPLGRQAASHLLSSIIQALFQHFAVAFLQNSGKSASMCSWGRPLHGDAPTQQGWIRALICITERALFCTREQCASRQILHNVASGKPGEKETYKLR